MNAISETTTKADGAGRNVVVVGTQWGDEGKGKVVDWLTDHAQGWCASRAATTPATRS